MGRASRRKREYRPGRPPRRSDAAAKLAAIPGVVGVRDAWDRLEAAGRSVVEQGAAVSDFARLGATGELAATVSVLATVLEGDELDGAPSGERWIALDELEDSARWVSRACTVSIGEAVQAGLSFDELAFLGAVLVLRAELIGLERARAALGDQPKPPPDGTYLS